MDIFFDILFHFRTQNIFLHRFLSRKKIQIFDREHRRAGPNSFYLVKVRGEKCFLDTYSPTHYTFLDAWMPGYMKIVSRISNKKKFHFQIVCLVLKYVHDGKKYCFIVSKKPRKCSMRTF